MVTICSGRYIGLSLQRSSALRQSLHLSVHSVYPPLLSLPAAFTALSRVVDPLQDFQPVSSAVHQAGHPGCFESGERGSAECSSSADLAAHNLEQPSGQICQLFLACVHKHTQSTFFLSFRVLVAIHSLRTSPEHAGRVNGPSGKSWWLVRAGRRGRGAGSVKEG